jgi:hypothetical protein
MDLSTPISEDTEMSEQFYDSDTEMTSITPGSTYSCAITSSNDRSPEVRDARLANALLSLDEDIPSKFFRYPFSPRFISRTFLKFSQANHSLSPSLVDLDNSVQGLLKSNTNATPNRFGFMAFIVDDDYLDRQEEIAKKHATTPALPKSRSYHARKAAE